jgi:hypothetical protein
MNTKELRKRIEVVTERRIADVERFTEKKLASVPASLRSVVEQRLLEYTKNLLEPERSLVRLAKNELVEDYEIIHLYVTQSLDKEEKSIEPDPS